MEGDNRLAARLSHAANSRLVDKRYYTPSPAADWRAGRIQKENSDREEAYVQAVLKICEKEKIDTILPSFDPHVYVFSKNKERFEKLGILIPVPDYEIVITLVDKYRTIRAAQELGFPCPKTYLPESVDDLRRIAREVGFPLVIKPRFTAGGRGTQMAREFSGLVEKTYQGMQHNGGRMIQEYIPGNQKAKFNLLIDKKGDVKVAFCPKTLRNFLRLTTNFSTAQESSGAHPYTPLATKLVQKLGWWGLIMVETKIDPRDGGPKLMEINPRLGYLLWNTTELGINVPLMCLRIAREEEVEMVKDYSVGTILLDPIEDSLGLGFKLLDLLVYRFRIGRQGKTPIDTLNPPMTLKELIESYKQTYFNRKKKVFNPYFRYFFQDPLVSVLWWLQFSTSMLRTVNQLGR
jgi:predicted ATP-grasp superfamily ATP-dependent carboligase